MSLYRTQPGDSPGRIAKKLGVTVGALIAANPHKPTTVVAGKQTFRGLLHRENLHIPRAGGGSLGLGAVAPAAPGAPHAMIRKGSKGADVALWQTIIGATADGDFGPKTDTLTRSWQGTHGLAADGIVGPKTWAAALGAGAPVTVATPAVAPAPVAASSGLAAAASAALSALRSDPNYCTNVAKTGTAVNTGVHNFKAAWNSANPSRAVPIGTGKYEVSVAAALWSALGGQTDVPPGCGAAGVPAAAAPAPVASIPLPPSVTMPAPSGAPPPPPPPMAPPAAAASNIPAAVQALASIDPCDQANVGLVTTAQRALGVSADGKYGNDTSNAARRLMPSAPAGCSPRPQWWTPPGQSSAPGAGGGAAPPAAPPQVSVPQPSAGGVVTPPSSGGAVTTTTTEKKLSTGAIVAGAVGAAALVGLAVMAMSKKTGHRGARGARGPSRRKTKRKSAHRSKRKSKR